MDFAPKHDFDLAHKATASARIDLQRSLSVQERYSRFCELVQFVNGSKQAGGDSSRLSSKLNERAKLLNAFPKMAPRCD